MEPVRDHFRHVSRLFRQLFHCLAGRCGLVASDRLALDVRLGDHPRCAVLTFLAVRAGDPALLGDAWPLAGRFAGVGAFDG